MRVRFKKYMEIQTITPKFAKNFLNNYHPLKSKGALKGAIKILGGYENGFPMFVAVFTSPRSRWKNYNVTLELSRLAWSPLATGSASTFLRKCTKKLTNYNGLIVTYALPGTEGIVYSRAGFKQNGHSSGCPWSKRGKNERATPNTIGTGQHLKRFFYQIQKKSSGKNPEPPKKV